MNNKSLLMSAVLNSGRSYPVGVLFQGGNPYVQFMHGTQILSIGDDNFILNSIGSQSLARVEITPKVFSNRIMYMILNYDADDDLLLKKINTTTRGKISLGRGKKTYYYYHCYCYYSSYKYYCYYYNYYRRYCDRFFCCDTAVHRYYRYWFSTYSVRTCTASTPGQLVAHPPGTLGLSSLSVSLIHLSYSPPHVISIS